MIVEPFRGFQFTILHLASQRLMIVFIAGIARMRRFLVADCVSS